MKTVPFFVIILLSCLRITAQNTSDYHHLLKGIREQQAIYKRILIDHPEMRDAIISEASLYFAKTLSTIIIPQWYGTKWNFNGYTNTPKEGYIACGYFVSTTLKHIGLNINRYKMAQQSAINEVKTVSISSNPIILKNISIEELDTYCSKNLAQGIYIIGLDNHVGYLLRKNETTWFIHSNYLEPSEVIKEKLISSQALSNSYSYAIGVISTNSDFILKWIQQDPITIITN